MKINKRKIPDDTKLIEMSSNMNNEQSVLRIRRVSLFRLFWFTRLNLKIHEMDPLFKKAQQNLKEKIKFFINFSFKLIPQYRFALTLNKKVIGALALEKKKKSVFIYAVGIKEEFRRKGFGTYLMNYSEDFALRKGREFVNFSVLLQNKPAIKLYEKLGYKSQGLGLTLVRYLERVAIKNAKTNNQTNYHIILTPNLNSKYYQKIAKEWWLKEIAYSSGKDAAEICRIDKMLDFEIKSNWKNYEIKQDNEKIGYVAILPFDLFPTIVVFSNPEKTWNEDWTRNFLKLLTKKAELDKKSNSSVLKARSVPIVQIFLTHQHKDALLKDATPNYFVSDTTEDRQILFKKLHLNN